MDVLLWVQYAGILRSACAVRDLQVEAGRACRGTDMKERRQLCHAAVARGCLGSETDSYLHPWAEDVKWDDCWSTAEPL